MMIMQGQRVNDVVAIGPCSAGSSKPQNWVVSPAGRCAPGEQLKHTDRPLQAPVFAGRDLPENITLNVVRSQADLDQKHILPNSGNMLRRGVWFPLGHELL
jgi:hypothetical protein